MSHQAGWELERYCALLQLWADQLRLDPRLQRRFDAGDLVQETLLKAHARQAAFRGTTEAERIGWLHEILASTLIDEVRKARARMRDVALERSLEDLLARPTARLEELLASRQPSPSQQAEQRERLLHLARVIEQLPDNQRDVVILSDLMQQSVPEIAKRFRRSRRSVASLLYRGRRRGLRELLADSPLGTG